MPIFKGLGGVFFWFFSFTRWLFLGGVGWGVWGFFGGVVGESFLISTLVPCRGHPWLPRCTPFFSVFMQRLSPPPLVGVVGPKRSVIKDSAESGCALRKSPAARLIFLALVVCFFPSLPQAWIRATKSLRPFASQLIPLWQSPNDLPKLKRFLMHPFFMPPLSPRDPVILCAGFSATRSPSCLAQSSPPFSTLFFSGMLGLSCIRCYFFWFKLLFLHCPTFSLSTPSLVFQRFWSFFFLLFCYGRSSLPPLLP